MKYNFHGDINANEIIKTVYIVRALRNEITHSPFSIKFKVIHPSLNKEKVIELMRYSWKYAKEKYSFGIKSYMFKQV